MDIFPVELQNRRRYYRIALAKCGWRQSTADLQLPHTSGPKPFFFALAGCLPAGVFFFSNHFSTSH
jgi:hypothetical protein